MSHLAESHASFSHFRILQIIIVELNSRSKELHESIRTGHRADIQTCVALIKPFTAAWMTMSSTNELETRDICRVLSHSSVTSCTPDSRWGAHIEVKFAVRRISFTFTIHAVHPRYCESTNASPPRTLEVEPRIRRPLTIVTTARLPLVAAMTEGILTVPWVPTGDSTVMVTSPASSIRQSTAISPNGVG